jgi:hypothetical protein
VIHANLNRRDVFPERGQFGCVPDGYRLVRPHAALFDDDSIAPSGAAVMRSSAQSKSMLTVCPRARQTPRRAQHDRVSGFDNVRRGQMNSLVLLQLSRRASGRIAPVDLPCPEQIGTFDCC